MVDELAEELIEELEEELEELIEELEEELEEELIEVLEEELEATELLGGKLVPCEVLVIWPVFVELNVIGTAVTVDREPVAVIGFV